MKEHIQVLVYILTCQDSLILCLFATLHLLAVDTMLALLSFLYVRCSHTRNSPEWCSVQEACSIMGTVAADHSLGSSLSGRLSPVRGPHLSPRPSASWMSWHQVGSLIWWGTSPTSGLCCIMRPCGSIIHAVREEGMSSHDSHHQLQQSTLLPTTTFAMKKRLFV